MFIVVIDKAKKRLMQFLRFMFFISIMIIILVNLYQFIKLEDFMNHNRGLIQWLKNFYRGV